MAKKEKLVINGKWKLVKPISGPYKRKEIIKTKMNINSESVRSTVVENNKERETEHGVEANVKASWSVVDVEVSAKYNNIEKDIKNSKLEESLKESKSFE